MVSRELPGPRPTCQPTTALADQAVVATGVCQVGGTGHQHFYFLWDSIALRDFSHVFVVLFSLSFAIGTGKGDNRAEWAE